MIETSTIKAERARLGLSQAELAQKAGVGLSTVQKIERGEIEDIVMKKALSVLNVLGLPK